MPDEVREHLTRDRRPFLHPESLQILQIHSSMTVLLLFSSPHSFSTGFRSEDWNDHSRRLVLFSVTHFCVVFEVCVWIIVRLEDPNMAHYKISNRVSHLLIFYLLVFDSVIDITKRAQEYFQKPLSVNTICRAICRCQLKLYHAKTKPYVNMVQKRRCVLWAKALLKWTVSKWKSVLWSDKSKFDILVGNHGRHVLRAKEEGDLPACYQRSVQKPASLMVWGA